MSMILSHGGRSPQARTVLIYGNCQCPILAQIFSGIDDLNDDYRFLFAPNHALPGEEAPTPSDEIFASVALLLEQHDQRGSPPGRAAIQARLPASCPRVRFPALALGCLWPFECVEPRNFPEAAYPWGRYPYGDAIGLSIANLTLPDEEQLPAYQGLSHRKMPNLDQRLQRDINRMARHDAASDVRIGDYVQQHFRQKNLFWTSAHPTSALLGALALRIFGAIQPSIGGTLAAAEASVAAVADSLDAMAAVQVPIHPLVASSFELEYAPPDRTYRWYGNAWSFPEYILRYIRHDTNWELHV